MLSSILGSTSIAPRANDASTMVPLSIVRDVLTEIAAERKKNIDFRQSVTEHEQSELASNPKAQKPPVKQVQSRGGRSGGGASSMQPANKKDLQIKPPNNKNIPRTIPKRISNQVVFDMVRTEGQIQVQGTTPSELNFTASLSDHPQSNSWRALFDQWCIPQFTVTYFSDTPPGSTVSMPKLYTAIDFDNNNNFGNPQTLEDYSTCAINVMNPNARVVRSVRPTIKMDGMGTQGSFVSRQWCDSAAPSTPWFGIRTIATQDSIGTAIIYWWRVTTYAFRNQI